MKLQVLVLVLVLEVAQFGPRPPLTPAETLLPPGLLDAIASEPSSAGDVSSVVGSDAAAGEIFLTCAIERCVDARAALQKLDALVRARRLPQPARTIRLVTSTDPFSTLAARARAAIHVAPRTDRPLQIVRGLWSTAALGDEVVELFATRANPSIEVRAFEDVGQLPLDPFGVATTAIVTNPAMSNQIAAVIAAQAAYFLATLPNEGAEALLSHLTVGAHARLAEDGRRAVAQMGTQQRAGADVLIMFAQAIEREQRRMRSFERFMPAPVDPMLRSRIADMETGITAVWTSMGITSSPFVPAAERIRGRGGEDRRVPTRAGAGRITPVEPPSAFLKFTNTADVLYELGNLVDGKRTISDIRDALTAEFGPIALPVVVDYFERLATAGAVSLK